MTLKSIGVFVDATPEGEKRVRHGSALVGNATLVVRNNAISEGVCLFSLSLWERAGVRGSRGNDVVAASSTPSP